MGVIQERRLYRDYMGGAKPHPGSSYQLVAGVRRYTIPSRVALSREQQAPVRCYQRASGRGVASVGQGCAGHRTPPKNESTAPYSLLLVRSTGYPVPQVGPGPARTSGQIWGSDYLRGGSLWFAKSSARFR
jgi:hypothetical protein